LKDLSEISMDMSLGKKPAAGHDENGHGKKLSALLQDLSDNAGEKITLGEIAQAMADRSFGAFLVVFCLPNLIPLPPGATIILGLPLVFIAFQMAFSRLDTIWLPKRLSNYAFDNRAFARVLARFVPWMEWGERFIRPRLWPQRARLFERGLGVVALILAIIVFLPIPAGNLGPSYALALMGIGLVERDGLTILIGLVIGVVFSVILAYVGYETAKAIPHIIEQIPVYWDQLRHYVSG